MDLETARRSIDESNITLRRVGGAILAASGVTGFLAGALHPQGARGDFRQTIAAMLQDGKWPAAHWLAMTSFLLLVVGLWLLADGGWMNESTVARIGTRLATASALFMMVEFCVEFAARSAAAQYAAGLPVAEVALTEPMQTIGWPAVEAGIILLVLGLPRLAPWPVRALGVAGSAALGVGGVLTMGLHVAAAGPLFIGGAASALWITWVGVRTAVGTRVESPALGALTVGTQTAR